MANIREAAEEHLEILNEREPFEPEDQSAEDVVREIEVRSTSSALTVSAGDTFPSALRRATIQSSQLIGGSALVRTGRRRMFMLLPPG